MRKQQAVQEKAQLAVSPPAGDVHQKPSVAICVPCGGPVEPRAMVTVATVAAALAKHGFDTLVGSTTRVLVHTARNWLTKQFLETGAEWMLWIDSDMILPPNAGLILLKWAYKLQAKWLTGVYYQRQGGHRPLVLRRDPTIAYTDDYTHHYVVCGPDQKEPFKVDAAGFGIMLIHRDVIAGLKMPYFRHEYINDELEASEDFYFCVRARKAGFQLWACPEIECGHIGEPPIIGRADFDKVVKKDDLRLISVETVKAVAAQGAVNVPETSGDIRRGNEKGAVDHGPARKDRHMDHKGDTSPINTSSLPGSRLRLRFSEEKQDATVGRTERKGKSNGARSHGKTRSKTRTRTGVGRAGTRSANKLATAANHKHSNKNSRRISGKNSAA